LTTSRADAARAARVYKDTQPQIDALKDVLDANKSAKDVLGDYMLEQKPPLTEFSGVTLRVVSFKTWDGDKLTVYLGEKLLGKFRLTGQRKYFGFLKRRAKSVDGAIR